MISKELLDWVKRQVALIDEKFKDGLTTKNEAIFAQVVKLAEEVGELIPNPINAFRKQS